MNAIYKIRLDVNLQTKMLFLNWSMKKDVQINLDGNENLFTQLIWQPKNCV